MIKQFKIKQGLKQKSTTRERLPPLSPSPPPLRVKTDYLDDETLLLQEIAENLQSGGIKKVLLRYFSGQELGRLLNSVQKIQNVKELRILKICQLHGLLALLQQPLKAKSTPFLDLLLSLRFRASKELALRIPLFLQVTRNLLQTSPHILVHFQKSIFGVDKLWLVLHSLLNQYARWLHGIDCLKRVKQQLRPLMIAPIPYLTRQNKKSRTLVLDLDETLIHARGKKVLYRPFLNQFLKETAKNYQLVLFTAALQDYADWVLRQVQAASCIEHRLYRQHTVPCDGVYLKDLARLGRPLNSIIILDNTQQNFSLQKENGVKVLTWQGQTQDEELLRLLALLDRVCREEHLLQGLRKHLRVEGAQPLREIKDSRPKINRV